MTDWCKAAESGDEGGNQDVKEGPGRRWMTGGEPGM